MQQAEYHRVYTDDSGVSHFETVMLDLIPADFSPPTDPLNVAQFRPGAGTFWAGMPPDWNGGMPHPSPQRQLFCVLQGEMEVTASDGVKAP